MLRAQGHRAPIPLSGYPSRSAGRAGHGSFSVTDRGGIVVGESTRVDAGYVGFGRIHDEVLGGPIGSVQRSDSGRRGIANAYGAKGAEAQCKDLISGPATWLRA